MHILLLIILLMTCGCTTMDHSQLVSPSESSYYKANRFYEEKSFRVAIELYEDFLESNPRSDLAVPAKLNLGMSHYYTGNYKQAHSILKEIDLKDENIKEYVGGVLKICEAEAGAEIKAQEQAQMAAAADKAKGGQIEVEVLDTYVDDFGSVVVSGKTNRVLTVLVDGVKATLDGNNIFTASVSWKKGQSIAVVAKDESGGLREIDYYPDGESPEKPRGLNEVNTTTNSAEIEWDENYEDDIKGYRLYYRLQGKSTREVPEIITDTKYEVVGLQTFVEGANKTFEFYLRAVDKMNNESDDSEILEVTIP